MISKAGKTNHGTVGTTAADADLVEDRRLRALESYRILDTLPEAAYDDIVRLASLICGAPMAMVSLIDRERQWFKAAVGIDVHETPRGVAFCDHAIRMPGHLLEVEDARLDPRFATNPLVVDDPGIRFYAGMPILSGDGHALGTVCVIDSQPHTLSDAQCESLHLLSRLTTQLLEGRRTALLLERRKAERDFNQRAMPDTAKPGSVLPGTTKPDTASTAQVPTDRYAVAVVEVEGFAKLLADQGGAAVIQLQEILQQCLPAELVCPHGGTEFLLILSQGGKAPDQLAALRDSVAAGHGLSLIIGAAIAQGADEAMERVFERAEEALRLARAQSSDGRLVVDGQVRATA